MDLRAYLAGSLVQGLTGDVEKAVMAGFEADGTDTAVHSRQILYALGYAAFRNFPGNKHFGNVRLWEAGMRMVDEVCARQAEDGSWQWRVPISNKVWPTGQVWSVYFWLRAVEDFGQHFGAERLARFRKALEKTVAGRMTTWEQYQMTGERRTSLNIFVWTGLELWLGGRVLGNERWLNAGKEMVERCVRRQKPDGWWPDAQRPRGPVVMYNGVTLSAASVYARLSGDAYARETVRRAAGFHLDFCYPDGTLIETIDERNRYGKQKPTQGNRAGQDRLVCAFAPFEETRHTAAFFAADAGSAGAPGPNMEASRFADVLDAVAPGEAAPPMNRDGAAVYDIPALVRRRAPWVCCLSGGTTEVRGSLFHLELQNHISLWHPEHGLIIGGGNSLRDASFSTVRMGGRYLATGGQVRAEAGRDVLTLRFGDAMAHIGARILDARSVRFEVRTEGSVPDDSEFALIFPGAHGKEFEQWQTRRLDEETVYMDWAIQPDRLFSCRIGAVAVESDTVGIVTWPHHPISIYNAPARLPIEDACARVAIPINSEPRSVTVRLV